MVETRHQGRAVSRGISVGTIVCLYGTRRQFFRRSIAETEIDGELSRLTTAFADAARKLDSDIEQAAGSTLADILQTHKYILLDPSFRSLSDTNVSDKRMNAEWAVQSALDSFGDKLASGDDAHIQEKRLDLNDVGDRILAGLGTSEISIELGNDTIIAARELSPAMFMRLAEQGIVGVISESGGWTSHTSILTRELGIPAITGMTDLFDTFKNGMRVSIDGFTGEVVIDPVEASGAKAPDFIHMDRNPDSTIGTQAFETADGRAIRIRTNTTSVKGYYDASQLGASGIGLYRSESLIGNSDEIPTESEQVEKYNEIAEAVGDACVHIRTFDLDASQYPKTAGLRQKNPALGLRAIRLGLSNDELLRTQIRALLRSAADYTNIGLVIPMVSGMAEVVAVKAMIAEATRELENERLAYGSFEVGAMIEVPSSVLVIDQLAKACDFFCLGTNDLAQYMLAADRDNESVSKWFRTLHPAMLRAVKKVIDECNSANKPLVVCGEMAGSPFYVPVLIGLGATELSMNPSSISSVATVVSGIEYRDAVDLVSQLSELSDPDAMEHLVAEIAQTKWPHLFAPGFLELQTA